MPRKRDVWDPRTPVEKSSYNWVDKPRLGEPIATVSGHAANALTVVDLFSGCGGISTGFGMAGFKPILGVDIHAPSVKTFAKNHPTAATILGDIKKLRKADLLAALNGSEVDAVVGGAPCQGFSICNRKQYDDDPRNKLFVEYMRVLGWLQPRFAFFENVATISSAGSGEFAELIEEHFTELGYNVVSGPVNAAEYGAPQRRIRWIFLASRDGEPGWPTPTHGPGKAQFRTVEDAIGDLPVVHSGESADSYAKEPYREYQRLMRGNATTLYNHEAPTHPEETIKRIQGTSPGEPMYPSFKQRIRLRWDLPSPTIVAGGIRPQFSLGHPREARGLTVRENCRLQSFPDSFEVLGGIVQGRVQTGNAVPPLLAKAFAESLLQSAALTEAV